MRICRYLKLVTSVSYPAPPQQNEAAQCGEDVTGDENTVDGIVKALSVRHRRHVRLGEEMLVLSDNASADKAPEAHEGEQRDEHQAEDGVEKT